MTNKHLYGLILAGGRGTRFWPKSRKRRAKQVLDFLGEGTLIQQTASRLSVLIPPERLWILTNNYLRDEIVRQLPEVPKKQILAEPAQRNTAPAIGLAAHILQSIDPDAVMGVFPSDHYVSKPKRFLKLVKAAYREAAQGRIALLGLQPRWPETGYGYVEFPPGEAAPGSTNAVRVVRFREKPSFEDAQAFVAAGNFFWNGGMFFWRAGVVLDQLARHLPKTAGLLAELPKFGSRQFGAKLAEVFPQCENISIDYAVLERAEGVVGIAADDIGWNDVGSWNAVYELLPRDKEGNTRRGDLLPYSSSGNFVDVPGKLVALLGVKDLVIVDTPDALLIADRHRVQNVGDLVKHLEARKRDELL